MDNLEQAYFNLAAAKDKEISARLMLALAIWELGERVKELMEGN